MKKFKTGDWVKIIHTGEEVGLSDLDLEKIKLKKYKYLPGLYIHDGKIGLITHRLKNMFICEHDLIIVDLGEIEICISEEGLELLSFKETIQQIIKEEKLCQNK